MSTEPAGLVHAVRVVATVDVLLSSSVIKRLVAEFADRGEETLSTPLSDVLMDRECGSFIPFAWGGGFPVAAAASVPTSGAISGTASGER